MANSLEHIQLAPDLKIPRILTGLWQIADMERAGKIDLEKTADSMAAYAGAGLTAFDMADHYGSAELVAGKFRQKHPHISTQMFTKWVPKPKVLKKDDVVAAVKTALEKLQTQQLDLLQFHAWNYGDPCWLDCLFWLQELQQEGLIRHLGLTNFDTAHLRIVVSSGIKVVSNQLSFSLVDMRAAGAMSDFCLKHNIKLLAFGTVGGGFISERWVGKPEPVPAKDKDLTWSQMKYKRFIDVAGGWKLFQDVLQTVSLVAQRHKVSITNVASRYILEQPAVGAVIIGARLGKSENIKQNLSLFDFSLTTQDKAEIGEALSKLKAIPGDCGDEYRKPPFLTVTGNLSQHVDRFPAPFPTKQGPGKKNMAMSGTMWEDLAGFSRAVRNGKRIIVSGTTATHQNGLMGGTDPAAQTHFVIDKIEGAIQSLGGKLEDVVRTRVYVKNLSDWEAVARAHGERFKDIQPANTLVRADLVGEEYLVEIEAEAILTKAKDEA